MAFIWQSGKYHTGHRGVAGWRQAASLGLDEATHKVLSKASGETSAAHALADRPRKSLGVWAISRMNLPGIGANLTRRDKPESADDEADPRKPDVASANSPNTTLTEYIQRPKYNVPDIAKRMLREAPHNSSVHQRVADAPRLPHNNR